MRLRDKRGRFKMKKEPMTEEKASSMWKQLSLGLANRQRFDCIMRCADLYEAQTMWRRLALLLRKRREERLADRAKEFVIVAKVIATTSKTESSWRWYVNHRIATAVAPRQSIAADIP